jgi:hypothetical protein
MALDASKLEPGEIMEINESTPDLSHEDLRVLFFELIDHLNLKCTLKRWHVPYEHRLDVRFYSRSEVE